MKRAALSIVIACVIAHGEADATSTVSYAALVRRALPVPETQVRPRDLVRRFDRFTTALDSLLATYSPLDTLSWSIGFERVASIARCYSALDLPAEALPWWKLLARIDTRGRYARESYGGILRSAAGVFDSTALAGVINRAVEWDDAVVRSLGPELAGAFEALRVHRADSTWLAERFANVRMLLPPIDAAIFEAGFLGDRGRWGAAYDLVSGAAGAANLDAVDAVTAHRLVEALYRTALWSGAYAEARAILDAMEASGDEAFVLRARVRRVDIELLEGRLSAAETEYQALCRGTSDDASCFWQDFLARFREVAGRVREKRGS